VLTFFIAGLLFICASSTLITWERTASRLETGLLISSDFDSYLEIGLGFVAEWWLIAALSLPTEVFRMGRNFMK